MQRWLVLVVGIFIGQWLSFGGAESPATVNRLAREAWLRHDWQESARQWSRAVSIQPDNAYFNYMRAASLARLGHRHAAADGMQIALLLNPSDGLENAIRSELATLSKPDPIPVSDGSTVPLENGRGVWVAPILVNGRHAGRFLVDTGSSVVVLSPAFAKKIGAAPRGTEMLELETVGGRTRAPWTRLDSLRVAGAEARDVEVVIHSPGVELDGILGNSFLARWDVSIDPDRRLLTLRRPESGDPALYASPK